MAGSARNRTKVPEKTQNDTSIKVLDYYDKFHCIGSACESNCCNSWVIFVDEESYAKYRQIDKDNGTDYFRHVIRRTDQPIISLNPDGYCPYLADDNLCGMVKTYGESALSLVCKIYPRRGRLIKHANTAFMSCAISCPQAMRLAIMRKKRLRFLDAGQFPRAFPLHISYAGVDRIGGHTQVLEAIHEAFIDLARNQDKSLNTRMAAMLLLSFHVAKLDPLHKVEDALTLLEDSLHVKKTNFADIPDLPGDIGHQFTLFVLFATKIISVKHANQKDLPARKKFFALIDESFAGFGLNSFEAVTEENFARYVQAQTNIIKPYLDANPHIWENLLAHYLLTSDFPFNKNQAPLPNLIYLGILLLFGRGLLAGYALRQGKVTDAGFVHVFHTIFREIDHDPKSAEMLNAFVTEIMADSIGQLYTILSF